MVDWFELGLVFAVGFLLPIFPLFPIRLAFLIPLAAATVNPVLVVAAASLGSSLGTVPLYGLTAGVRDLESIRRWRQRPWVLRILRALEGKLFLTTFVFALFPLPDQVMSVINGLKSYPVWRMALAFFLGRLPYYILLAYLGSSQRERIAQAWHAILGALGI